MEYILRLDMSKHSVTEGKVPVQYEDKGGRALTSNILYDEVPAGCDPLGPNNKIIFAPGLLGGTGASSSGRLSVGAKSPLTKGIKEANSGGTAGGYLARIGVRALVVEGETNEGEKYILHIGKDRKTDLIKVDFEVKGAYELIGRLCDKWSDKIAVICVGPAGINRFRGASVIISDPDFDMRFAARGGLGAVMGGKGLLAVVIDPPGKTHRIPVDKNKFNQTVRKLNKQLIESPKTKNQQMYGTASIVSAVNEMGALPTRNFSSGSFEGVKTLTGEALHDLIDDRGGEGKYGKRCMPGCIIKCCNVVPDADGKSIVSTLQYETIGLLGSNCGFSSLDHVARLNRLCNDIGLDTIEAGAALGVAMEAGLVNFGDFDGATALLEEVREATPTGRIIGNGALITGQVLGVKRIPVSKGQAYPAYDPRALKGNGVTYATSPMGADHTAGNAFGDRKTTDPLKKTEQVKLSRNLQLRAAVLDMLGFCIFARPPLFAEPQIMVDMLNGMYDWDLDEDKIWQMGRDLLEIEWAFNEREGFTPDQDRLPEIFTMEPLSPTNAVFDVDQKEMAGLRKFD